jgi:hypothetical protein
MQRTNHSGPREFLEIYCFKCNRWLRRPAYRHGIFDETKPQDFNFCSKCCTERKRQRKTRAKKLLKRLGVRGPKTISAKHSEQLRLLDHLGLERATQRFFKRHKLEDGEVRKQCCTCEKWFPLTRFRRPPSSTTTTGHHPECKSCQNERSTTRKYVKSLRFPQNVGGSLVRKYIHEQVKPVPRIVVINGEPARNPNYKAEEKARHERQKTIIRKILKGERVADDRELFSLLHR